MSAPRLGSTWQLKGNLWLPGWVKRGGQGQRPKPAAKSPRPSWWWDGTNEWVPPSSLTKTVEHKLFSCASIGFWTTCCGTENVKFLSQTASHHRPDQAVRNPIGSCGGKYWQAQQSRLIGNGHKRYEYPGLGDGNRPELGQMSWIWSMGKKGREEKETRHSGVNILSTNHYLSPAPILGTLLSFPVYALLLVKWVKKGGTSLVNCPYSQIYRRKSVHNYKQQNVYNF